MLVLLTSSPSQLGQCGNQVGCRFWEMALREHAAHNAGGRYDEPLSSFFANRDSRSDLPVGDGRGPIRTLKARAVLVDMEEGVLGELQRGPLGASSPPPPRVQAPLTAPRPSQPTCSTRRSC